MNAEPNDRRTDDLHWAAYQYVNGELPAERRESFESRLLDDQEAREAVAAAVELTQTMAAAVSHPVVTGSPVGREAISPRGREHWLAVVGAVGLLVLLFAVGLRLNPTTSQQTRAPLAGPGVESPGVEPSSDVELALIWGELVEQEESANGAGDELLDDPTEEDLGSQDWMLAALASMKLAEEEQK